MGLPKACNRKIFNSLRDHSIITADMRLLLDCIIGFAAPSLLVLIVLSGGDRLLQIFVNRMQAAHEIVMDTVAYISLQ